MMKKVVACFSLAAFIVASNACMMWGTREFETPEDYPRQEAKVSSLVKTSGETFSFSRSYPAHVRGDAITGTAQAGPGITKPTPVSIPLLAVASIQMRKLNAGMTILAVAGLVGISLILGSAIAIDTGDMIR